MQVRRRPAGHDTIPRFASIIDGFLGGENGEAARLYHFQANGLGRAQRCLISQLSFGAPRTSPLLEYATYLLKGPKQ
jgi:hypothetical protein